MRRYISLVLSLVLGTCIGARAESVVYVICEQTMANAMLTLRVNGELIPDGIQNPHIMNKKMWGQEMSIRPKCVRKFVFDKPTRVLFLATQDYADNGWVAEWLQNVKADKTYYIEFKHKGLMGGDYQFVQLDEAKGKKAVAEIEREDVLPDYVILAEQPPVEVKPAKSEPAKSTPDNKTKTKKKKGATKRKGRK